MILTFDQYLRMFPNAKAKTRQDYSDFTASCLKWHINTPERLSAFCAQVSHESAGLSRMVENLDYTAARLMQVWPRKFKTRPSAVEYQRKGSEAIANKVYEFRIGNGSESSGDGWRYRGRGYIQLTGKDNYRKYALATGLPLESVPDLAAEPRNAIEIACAFWVANGCNELADAGDLMGITRVINGGTIGFPEREALFTQYSMLLNSPMEMTA